MNIKIVEPCDYSILLPLAEQCCTELKRKTFDPVAFLSTWEMFQMSPFPSVVFGLYHEKEFVGGIGGVIVNDWLDGLSYAQEMFWYIQPEHRGGDHAKRLLMRLHQWAKEHGAVETRAGHPSFGSQERAFRAMYTRMGYTPLDTNYSLTL